MSATATHDPYQHVDALATKSSPIQKFLTLLALKTISRFYKWNGPSCIPISPRIIVKKGSDIDLTEAATMEFVSNRTNIPVPRVRCSFTHGNETYIVMERVRGKTLAEAWPELSDAQTEHILLQLRRLLAEMRSIPAPSMAIQSCVGGSLYDSRIPRPEPRFGPFPSTQAFHEWLREGLGPEPKPRYVDDEEWADIKFMIAMQNRESEPPVFTHGDLNPFNIMVRDGNIAAIIDWEFSGWLPPYWEYTSVWHGNKIRTGWQEIVTKFIDPWPIELRMEAVRQRWWGEF